MDELTIVNTGIEVLCIGVIAAFFAQMIKFTLYLVTHKEINFKILTTTGGMPSAHSAGVVGLATTVGLIEPDHFLSIEFAIAFGLALVVMYDAAGVRRAAGKMAATLNRIKDEFYAHNTLAAGEKLKELLGHTPIEVFMGAILGIASAYMLHTWALGHLL